MDPTLGRLLVCLIDFPPLLSAMMLVIVVVVVVLRIRIMVFTVMLTMRKNVMLTMLWAPSLHVLDGAVFAHVQDCGVKVHVMPTVVAVMPTEVAVLLLEMRPLVIITQQIEDIFHISLLYGRFTSAV